MGSMSVSIRNMTNDDWDVVEQIYAAGIGGGNATFATEPPSQREFFVTRSSGLSLVACETGGMILGWAAATPTSGREVYRGVVEHSVYVAPRAAGRGIGTNLLTALIEQARELGFWTLQASVFPENTSSLQLHEKVGFRQVGRRERIGFMTFGPHAGRWRDTVLIEKRL